MKISEWHLVTEQRLCLFALFELWLLNDAVSASEVM
jgi:hypothetical protein